MEKRAETPFRTHMKQRVMILGAGIFQAPLIRAAHEMGLETVVLCGRTAVRANPLADHLLPVDTTDIESVLRTAREYSVSAVATTGTDVSVPAMAAVAEALNLPGPTRRMAGITSSKTAFRVFQAEHGLNTPSCARCPEEMNAQAFCSSIPEEVVIKPDDSSGSRGVSILGVDRTPAAVALAFSKALSFSRTGVVCAESRLPGREAGGEAFFRDGRLMFFTTTDKHMDGVVVQGHSMPGSQPEDDLAAIRSEVERTAAALGYMNGPLNFDVMVDSGRATVIETGLRSGGNGIVDLVGICHGLDLSGTLLSFVLGGPAPATGHSQPETASSYVFGASVAGILRALPDREEVRLRFPPLIDLIYGKDPGDRVEPFLHNANLVGYALIRSGREQYGSHVEELGRLLRVEVDQ